MKSVGILILVFTAVLLSPIACYINWVYKVGEKELEENENV